MAQVTLIDQLGGVELKAKLADLATSATTADSATKDGAGNTITSTYTKTGDTQRYSAYSGGNGIVVTGTGINTKTIASNLVELPVHSGTGIKVELDSNQQYAIIRTLPEVLLYHTTGSNWMSSTSILPDMQAGTATQWNNLGQDGTLAVDNMGISGLANSMLYRCTAKFDIRNTSGSVADIAITASISFASGLTETVKQSVAGQDDSLLMVWYVRTPATGTPTIEFSATGLSSQVEAMLTDASVVEVCDA